MSDYKVKHAPIETDLLTIFDADDKPIADICVRPQARHYAELFLSALRSQEPMTRIIEWLDYVESRNKIELPEHIQEARASVRAALSIERQPQEAP